MNENSKEDYIIIIRSSNERTIKACKSILFTQVPEKTVQIVNLSPFEATLRKSYEIGINSGKKWMLTLDADVLLKKTAICDLIQLAESQDNSFFKIEGYIFDKLLLSYRLGGLKLYRIELLSTAINLIPNFGQVIRPETHVTLEMNKLGYSSAEFEMVFGLHDFEQYFKDIYRKVVVLSKKNRHKIKRVLEDWILLSKWDNDYKVALQAYIDGVTNTHEVKLDSQFYLKSSDDLLHREQINEKDPWILDDYQEYVDEVLEEAPKFIEKRGYFESAKIELKKRGVFRFLTWTSGKTLVLAGSFLIQLVNRDDQLN